MWARGYLAGSPGNIIDEVIQEYIEEQEREAVAVDSGFQIDLSYTPRLIDEGSSDPIPSNGECLKRFKRTS